VREVLVNLMISSSTGMCIRAEVRTFVLSETEASRNGFILNVIMVQITNQMQQFSSLFS